MLKSRKSSNISSICFGDFSKGITTAYPANSLLCVHSSLAHVLSCSPHEVHAKFAEIHKTRSQRKKRTAYRMSLVHCSERPMAVLGRWRWPCISKQPTAVANSIITISSSTEIASNCGWAGTQYMCVRWQPFLLSFQLLLCSGLRSSWEAGSIFAPFIAIERPAITPSLRAPTIWFGYLLFCGSPEK